MRFAVGLALLFEIAAMAVAQPASRNTAGQNAAGQGSVDPVQSTGETTLDRVRHLAAGLDSSRYSRRAEARDRLLMMGETARPILREMRGKGSFARRMAIEFVLSQHFSEPESARIPGGTVELGSDDPADKNPLRKTVVKPFLIGVREVTRLEYQRFLAVHGGPDPDGWIEGFYPYGTAALPVTGITYEQALACAAHYGGRLPTADEWELAARGTDGRAWPWGDEFAPGRANLRTRLGREGPAPVGSFPGDKSPYGIEDMAGNVREWVLDTGRTPPQPATKGGFYAAIDGRVARASHRAFHYPADDTSANLGMRIVRDPDGSPEESRRPSVEKQTR